MVAAVFKLTATIFILVVAVCYYSLPAHCDLDSNLNREVSTVNKIINKIDGKQLGSTRILHNFKDDNTNHELDLAQGKATFGPPGRSVARIKRNTASGRRKPPRLHLAQRPRQTTTSSTTTTTTIATTTVLDGAAELAADETGEPAKSDPGDNEEYEDSEGDSERNADSEPDNAASKTPVSSSKQSSTEASRPLSTGGSSRSGGKQAQSERKGNRERESNTRKVSDDTSDRDSTKKASTESPVKKKKPLVALPFIKPKNSSICIPEAYLEFPPDLIGNKWRSRGLVVVHIAVVCYMFYSLALVCERYFMPSLEEFAQRLQLSEDVAGATLMSAGSSAPELFTAVLGVFIAKGDIGTGTIVGSAVFNILFVIGICAFVSTTTAQLNWWPVLRDSVFYTFTVLVLIVCIYDERVTAFESFFMIALYGGYILIMMNNEKLKDQVTKTLSTYPVTAKLISQISSVEGPDDVFGGASSASNQPDNQKTSFFGSSASQKNYQTTAMIDRQSHKTVEDDSMFLAAMLIIIQHKRLFRSQLRFQSAARYIITKRQHKIQLQQQSSKCIDEVNYFGPDSEPLKSNQRDKIEAYARTVNLSKAKFSIVSKDDYEFWNRPPEEGENYYIWLAKIPVNYVLHYTIPDCSLYPDKYLFTFFISIIWTAFFSYIMVWMVTLIGYTFGIPDSVMGATFLAAGTSVPDCYSSVHAARNGMADMAVSNSIGSNVFDILIGLSLPWFIQTALYPGVVATINSRGVIYSVILLFLSLVVTIYLMNKYEWTLKPRLGLALLIAYGLFIVLTCMLEFNLFGHVNPPPCPIG